MKTATIRCRLYRNLGTGSWFSRVNVGWFSVCPLQHDIAFVMSRAFRPTGARVTMISMRLHQLDYIPTALYIQIQDTNRGVILRLALDKQLFPDNTNEPIEVAYFYRDYLPGAVSCIDQPG